MPDKMVKIGAAWKKTSNKGNKFISGQLEVEGKKIPFVMFVNSYKEEGSKQPDFVIYEGGKSASEDVF